MPVGCEDSRQQVIKQNLLLLQWYSDPRIISTILRHLLFRFLTIALHLFSDVRRNLRMSHPPRRADAETPPSVVSRKREPSFLSRTLVNNNNTGAEGSACSGAIRSAYELYSQYKYSICASRFYSLWAHDHSACLPYAPVPDKLYLTFHWAE